MDLGIEHGKKQQDSLLILTIISATKKLMSFAKSGVILHQLMDLHPIWLLKERINKANLVLDMYSITVRLVGCGFQLFK